MKRHYKKLSIRGRKIDEHRYVMEKKLERRLLPNEIVHHKDRIKLNNDPSNLEILSRSEHSRLHAKERVYNEDFSVKMRMIGIQTMTNNRFAASDVLSIRKRHAEGTTAAEIIKEYGCSKNAIYSIIRRETWKHI